ncbi:tetratricopeptide repeat protein [Trichodesmium erythraeum]|uniref:tetratricopeptide repeat protein n=1 Tax=Trichodesmium erythraeum TaxID=1206 RepID=UPI0009D7499E|nr:tetratricopeptide repeat protein [Trichodesmium erythraeum GBRTRLIN201]
MWEGLGENKLVIECRYKALILEPTSVSATECLNLGDKLLEVGKVEEAIACFVQSLQIKSSYIDVYHQIAKVLEKQNYINTAFKCRFSKKLPKNLLEKFCQLTGD